VFRSWLYSHRLWDVPERAYNAKIGGNMQVHILILVVAVIMAVAIGYAQGLQKKK